jgi:hypothetical protein
MYSMCAAEAADRAHRGRGRARVRAAIDVAATQFYDPATGRYRLGVENREIAPDDGVRTVVGGFGELENTAVDA